MKLSLNSLYAAPTIALALSLPLVALRNPAMSFIGCMGATGSLAYGSALVMLNDERKKANRAIARQQTQLDTRETELSTRHKNATAELQQKLQQAIKARDLAVADKSAELARIAAQRQQLIADAKAVMGDELSRKFEAEYEAKYQQRIADINRREDEFYHAEGELCDQIEALQTVLEQNESYLREEFGKETGAKVEQWAGRYQKLQGQIAQYGEVIQVASSEAMEEIQKKDLIIARLKGQVELLAAPKKYRGNSQDDATANKVLEFFLNRGIGVEAEDWQRSYHQLKVLLFPKGGKLADLATLADDLQVELGLYTRPVISVDGSCFSIQCDTDAKAATKVTLNKPPEELIRILREVNHLRVSAPTDSGKSTLMSNILYLLNGMYQGKQTTTLFDPKYPDSDWPIKPTFNEVEQCVMNAGLVGDTVKSRLDEARKAAEVGTQAPDHEPHLFVVDEIEFMYSEALAMADMGGELKNTAKHFKRSMKRGLKVGRSRNLKLLYVMQSHLCSDAGFNSADFLQSTNIFLGSNIPMVLATDGELRGRFSEDKRRKLLSEFQSLSAKGEKYIMLVVTANSREAFIMIPPKPNYFAEKDGVTLDSKASDVLEPAADRKDAETTADDKPKCRYCGTENVTYRRTKGDKKQYTCDEPLSLCSYKTFTI